MMADNTSAIAKLVCKGMREAGITDASSKEGIIFCTEQCPHPFCIIAETEVKKNNSALAVELRRKGVSVRDIELILGAKRKDVLRWIKKEWIP